MLVLLSHSQLMWGEDNFTSTEMQQHFFVESIYQDTTFTEVPISMINLGHGTAAWGDYDNDGDLDVLITGIGGRDGTNRDDPSPHISKIYRNDNGTFIDINAQLVGVNNNDGTIWCDYDNDGDLDLFIGGATEEPNANSVSKIYRNDNGTFTDINAALPGVVGTASWGDYDDDADLDLLIGGSPDNGYTFLTKLYRNDNGTFVEVNTYFPGVWGASFAWGDYDNDGDLDLLVTGFSKTDNWYPYKPTTKLYRNNSTTNNTTPTIPDGLIFTGIGNSVTLKWNKSSDNQTPQQILTYNIRLGTIPGGNQLVSGMSDVRTGYRMVPRTGNTSRETNLKIKNLPRGTYHWSVQAIDNSYAGSPFASEHIFTVTSTGEIIDGSLPNKYYLFQNYPNPFNPSTTISFTLAEQSVVSLKVYNLLGQEVTTLINNEELDEGEQTINFVADGLSSGIYFYRLVVNNGEYQNFKKMVLIK